MCSIEELEALVAGTLEADDAARVQAHVDGCASCREELQWLRAEAELMARRRERQADVSPALWDGIEARLADNRRRPASEEPGARPPAPAVSAASAHTTAPVRVARRWGVGARIAYGGLVAAAAAAVIVATWPGQVHNVPADLGRPAPVAAARKKLSADAALDQAEREYITAAKVLEAEYQAERGRLPPSVAERYDRMLNKTRTQVADARVQAGNDVDGRMVVLDGYAEYLRSLQTIVSDIR